MATVRDINNVNKLTDWTMEINEIENQYGFIKSQNLFNTRGTSQTAIVFDKNSHDITLLPQVSRSGREATYGKDRKVETFSLPLAYFKHRDYITPEDVQGWRQAGESDSEETLANVRVEKLTDMRLAADQTTEYMQLQAMKGVFKTPDGTTVADMFTEFGITQKAVNFDFTDATLDIDGKINEVKRHIASNAKTGGSITGVDFYVHSTWFDALIKHPKFREVYNQYQNSGTQRLRDDLSNYMTWGISDVVEHRGVRFISYDATFNLPDGTTEEAFDDTNTTGYAGVALPRGVRDLFRGYFGPSNKLSGANRTGQEMFAYEYTDPKDEFHELELEMAPLYFCTKPNVLVKLTGTFS